MKRVDAWIAALALIGLAGCGLLFLFASLAGADLSFLNTAPPPVRKPIAAIRLPSPPQAPKFEFAVGRRLPPPERRAAAKPARKKKRRRARSSAEQQLKALRRAMSTFKRKPKPAGRPRLAPQRLSNIQTQAADSGAYYQSTPPPAVAESARPAPAAAPTSAAPRPVRRMRSLNTRGGIAPPAVPAETQEDVYEEEEVFE